jgi:pimeloyl-ACP methyl ester carboxylesterase
MPVLNANGETIHYIIEGNGPAVALIHSLGTSVHMWSDLIAALKDHYTVIACDARGHGGSSGKGECSVASAAQDLKSVLDESGISECHLVGISAGGQVALTFAAQWPVAVKSLVLADTSVKPIEGSSQSVEATAEAIAYVSMEEFGTQYAAETLLPSTALDVQDALAADIARANPKSYIQLMRSAALGDFRALTAKINQPTLVLVGESDGQAFYLEAESLAKNLPNAKFEIVASAGHLACLDNPAAFNEAVERFLGSHR